MQFQLYTIVLLFCSMFVLNKIFFLRLLIDSSSDCICQSCTFSECWTSWNYGKHLINTTLRYVIYLFTVFAGRTSPRAYLQRRVRTMQLTWPKAIRPNNYLLHSIRFRHLLQFRRHPFAFYRNFGQFNPSNRQLFITLFWSSRHPFHIISISLHSLKFIHRTRTYIKTCSIESKMCHFLRLCRYFSSVSSKTQKAIWMWVQVLGKNNL